MILKKCRRTFFFEILSRDKSLDETSCEKQTELLSVDNFTKFLRMIFIGIVYQTI